MSKTFKVAELEAKENSKVQSFVKVIGTDIEMPVTLINGAKVGKTVVITGGTHGGEYPGVEASIRLAKKIDPSEVSGQIAIVHPVNILAFQGKTQYINPLDGKNLNRVFPGKATGTISEKIAYTITTEFFSHADFYMDLHGGDIHENLFPFIIYPKLGCEEMQKISLEASGLMGIPYILDSTSTGGTFGYAASMGVPGFLAEIGKCGRWCEDEVNSYIKGVENVLRYLEVIAGDVENLGKAELLRDGISINATATGCWYPCIAPGKEVKAGELMGEIKDYFGNTLATYTAEQDGVMLYSISSLAINEGDPILCLGLR